MYLNITVELHLSSVGGTLLKHLEEHSVQGNRYHLIVIIIISIIISIIPSIIIMIIISTTTTLQECERHITLLHHHRLDDVELGGDHDHDFDENRVNIARIPVQCHN